MPPPDDAGTGSHLMISFQIGNMSGNRVSESATELAAYIAANRHRWNSATLYSYVPSPTGISDLHEIEQVVQPRR